ncbi:hypothetical protein RB2083_652 [Rhodobacteraceae bacterium HTCC2083]|nr:hypothetical protein RB2083_652 [Rhodobacteraceae bacterium HTCC2083]
MLTASFIAFSISDVAFLSRLFTRVSPELYCAKASLAIETGPRKPFSTDCGFESQRIGG